MDFALKQKNETVTHHERFTSSLRPLQTTSNARKSIREKREKNCHCSDCQQSGHVYTSCTGAPKSFFALLKIVHFVLKIVMWNREMTRCLWHSRLGYPTRERIYVDFRIEFYCFYEILRASAHTGNFLFISAFWTKILMINLKEILGVDSL